MHIEDPLEVFYQIRPCGCQEVAEEEGICPSRVECGYCQPIIMGLIDKDYYKMGVTMRGIMKEGRTR